MIRSIDGVTSKVKEAVPPLKTLSVVTVTEVIEGTESILTERPDEMDEIAHPF